MQMNNENDIKQRFGTENHFTVPEGYFDQFASQLMAQLPEKEAKVVGIKANRRWKPLAIAAASVAFVALGAAMWFDKANDAQEAQMSNAQPSSLYMQTPSELEQAADYAMLDATDMYALLAGE